MAGEYERIVLLRIQQLQYLTVSTYAVLVGKPEGRGALGRPRRRWEDNIKMDLREVGWGHKPDRSGSE